MRGRLTSLSYHVVNAMAPRTRTDSKPWYKQPWLWFLISLPATAVVAGFVTLDLAIESNDGLVVDDYYERGKEINRVLERDKAAEIRKIDTILGLKSQNQALRLEVLNYEGDDQPDNIDIHFLHSTRSGLDQSVTASRQDGNIYTANTPELAPGRWNVQLSTPTWRIVGSLEVPGPNTVRIAAPSQ